MKRILPDGGDWRSVRWANSDQHGDIQPGEACMFVLTSNSLDFCVDALERASPAEAGSRLRYVLR